MKINNKDKEFLESMFSLSIQTLNLVKQKEVKRIFYTYFGSKDIDFLLDLFKDYNIAYVLRWMYFVLFYESDMLPFCRLYKLLNNGKSSVTEKFYKLKYGTSYFLFFNKRIQIAGKSNTLSSYIERHGKEKGTDLFYKNNRHNEQMYIDKYGEIEGKKRYATAINKWKKSYKGWKNKNTETFIKEAIKIHGKKYDYSKVVYFRNNKPIIVICDKHGEFTTTPNKHLLGYGCSICNESKGEKRIRVFLENKNIEFIREKKFEDCRSKIFYNGYRQLPFDFYLPAYNLLIEYDGIYHFRYCLITGVINEDFSESTSNNDKIKTEYAKSKYIKLLRISYDKYEEIDNILEETLNELKNCKY